MYFASNVCLLYFTEESAPGYSDGEDMRFGNFEQVGEYTNYMSTFSKIF